MKKKSKIEKIKEELQKPIVPRAPHRPTKTIKDKKKYDRKRDKHDSNRREEWNNYY